MGLPFAAVEGKYMWESGQVRVWAGPTVPTAGPETSLEVLEGLLGRQGLALAYCGSKDTDREASGKYSCYHYSFFLCFILFSSWCCCFYYFLSFIFIFLKNLIYIFLFFYFYFAFLLVSGFSWLCSLFFFWVFLCFSFIFSSLFLLFVCFLVLFYFPAFVFVSWVLLDCSHFGILLFVDLINIINVESSSGKKRLRASLQKNLRGIFHPKMVK